MTRCYFTRHGAGPFPSEVEGKPYEGIEDKTNVPNEFQQTLRFGDFDLDLFDETVMNDFKASNRANDENLNVVVTCLDQLDNDTIWFISGSKSHSATKEKFIKILESTFPNIYISEGETRDTISKVV